MSASVHRLPGAPAEPPRFGPAPLHRGERTTCPGCGQVRLVDILRGTKTEYRDTRPVCNGPSKVKRCASWWARLWRRCKERRNHYHQRCLDCGARWIVGFLEEIDG